MRRLFRFKEWIAILITIVSSILFLQATVLDKNKRGNTDLSISNENLICYTSGLNIIILIIGLIIFSTLKDDYYLIKRKHGEFDKPAWDDINSIGKILKISVDKSRYFAERTSAVVGQLVNNFTLFLWPLIIFYALNIAKEKLHLHAFAGFEDNFSFSMFTTANKEINSQEVFWYLAISALANIFNFISGIGLWVSFSVLYQKTLDADNKSTLHFGVYYFLLTSYILAYIILMGTDNHILPLKKTILALDMFCAVFNCVAMILFFNRLVQILYFYHAALKEKLLDKFYFFVVTILFPLYACFQIFFGVFDQLASMNKDHEYYYYVKGVVFLVCFLGKLFLILFLFTFIRIKWLHAAILTLMSNEETPMEIAKNVKAISNSIDKVNDDIEDINGK